MTKKMISWLSILAVFSVMLHSCRTDDLLTQENRNIQRAAINSRIIHWKELQGNTPLLSQLTRFSNVRITPGNTDKIYTDSENGFSVDLDDVLYTEDSSGNKTYTFKIRTRENSTGFLENLILKDLGDSQFEAYLSTYDQTAVEHLDQLTVTNLKDHVSLVYIGNRNGSEVFGKYNANSCQISVPVFVTIYVSGTKCYSGDHDYAHIGNCNYATVEGGYPPTESYSYTGISYDIFNTCDGGGASPGDGGGGVITTSPHVGGSSPTVTPCDRIKKSTQDIVYLSDVLDLEGKTGLDHEEGYRLNTPNGNQLVTQHELLVGVPGTKEINLGIVGNTFAVVHSHYKNLYPIFSPGDLIFFNQWISQALAFNAVPANTPKIPVNDLTLTVVTNQGNYLLAFDGTSTNTFPIYTEQQMDELIDEYRKNLDNAVIAGSDLYDMQKLEQEFLNFLSGKMNMTGLRLYRVQSDGNYEISLANPMGTKCPE